MLAPAVTPAARAQEGQTVAEVEVRGVKNTNPDVVRLAAQLKAGTPFRNATFEDDKRRIRDQGLYSAVTGRTETTPDGKLKVVYEVVENPVIANVVVTGNRAIKTETLLPLLRSKPGDVLNTATVDRDVKAIQDEYTRQGYVAFVSDQIQIDPRTNILTIPVIETVVESVEVQGNTKTKAYVIRREMKTRPGEPYNAQVVQRDLSRVFALGLFEDIGPARPEPGSDLGRVKLTIPVQERRTGQIGVGFGYSTRQRLVGKLELAETNFRGRGQGINFLWEVGGVASRNSFEVGFFEPWLDRRNTSLSVNLFDRVVYRFNRSLSSNATFGEDSDPYYEQRRGGSTTISRPFADTTRGYVTLRTEGITANNLRVNYNLLTNEEINNIRGSLVQSGNVSSVTLRTATNTRDNELDPAKGFFLSPSVELGSGSFDYERPRLNPNYINEQQTPGQPRVLVDTRKQSGSFTKANLDVRNYLSLSGPRRTSIREPKRVLATRVLFGAAGGNIGFGEQYFVGGADTLRGFPDDRFWGNRLFLASAELRVPFDSGGSLTGVLFADVGDAWGATEFNRKTSRGSSSTPRSARTPAWGSGSASKPRSGRCASITGIRGKAAARTSRSDKRSDTKARFRGADGAPDFSRHSRRNFCHPNLSKELPGRCWRLC
jgi:outer membrane protein insertion porin family